jgi:hypothetical protein
MGEEAFDETILAADTGTLTIRGGYGRKKVWLGIHQGNDPEGTPDMGIFLTPRQQKALAEAIEWLTFVTVQDMQERIEDAKYALEKISQGHVFETADDAEKWARDIADNALDALGG